MVCIVVHELRRRSFDHLEGFSTRQILQLADELLEGVDGAEVGSGHGWE